jgi:hypothetical protein
MTTSPVTAAPSLAHSATGRLRRERAATDWSGLWFKLVEDDGEFVGMRGGRRAADNAISWVFPSHATYDGLGGFVQVLRDSYPGRHFAVPVRKSRPPSLLARTTAVLRLLARKPKAAAAWKGHDSAWRGQRTRAGTEFATSIWDVAATRRLDAKARAHGVPLNSLLLQALGEASRPELEAGPEIWMMPVNMRGPVALDRDTANQTGYLEIEITGDRSVAQVQEQLKLALRRRDHWATWLFLNASRLVGYAGIRQIYKVQMARFEQRPFVGAFSNLGRWKGVGDWHVCPPVSKTCPVGAGAIVCDGKLSLTVEAHPSIAREAGWTRALMDRWTVLLQSDH